MLNDVVENTENCSFVLIGQILDRDTFNKLNKKINYLGDKHYNDYPMYVKSFDVCFIPYVVGEKEHGGDSIKVYEFLAAGTWANGKWYGEEWGVGNLYEINPSDGTMTLIGSSVVLIAFSIRLFIISFFCN